jgi:hypothetical protein
MKNYICKWPNGDVVLVSARNRQEVRLILDEVGDPGNCEIVQFKGPFAIELNPKMPKRPVPVDHDDEQYFNPFGDDEFVAPDDPTKRPLVSRAAGNTATTFPADVWQEAGGQLTPQEAAGLQRWRDATAANAQHPANTGPWVTKEDLEAAGLIDEPYHVQVTLGSEEYGRYTSRLYKGITKAFFPRTYEALKAVQEIQDDYGDAAKAQQDEAIQALAAAVSLDVCDKNKAKEFELKQAKLWVDALAGNREALVAIMTDQSANPYGPAAGDEEEEDEDSDMSGDGDDSDGGFDLMQAIRAGRAGELAATFGAAPPPRLF